MFIGCIFIAIIFMIMENRNLKLLFYAEKNLLKNGDALL